MLWEKYDGDPFRPPKATPAVDRRRCSSTRRPTNLIRIFFLQERMKGLGKGVEFEARRVHVIGAGVMGGDIADGVRACAASA